MAHIALVVGHHPDARGARSVGGVFEYDYNTIVAGHLSTKLRDAGHRVSRVERPSPSGIAALAQLVNATGADVCVELHFNAAGAAARGSEMLHWHSSGPSRQLALLMQQEVVGSFPLHRRPLKALRPGDRGATLLQQTAMPCILTEPFFGSSVSDWNLMQDAHEPLGGAYARGLAAFFAWRGDAVAVPRPAHPPNVQAVIDAWSISGPDPAAHRRAQQNLQQSWPALADALRQLAEG